MSLALPDWAGGHGAQIQSQMTFAGT